MVSSCGLRCEAIANACRRGSCDWNPVPCTTSAARPAIDGR